MAGNTALNADTIDAVVDHPQRGPTTRVYKPQIDRYVILHQLGAGGMGAVFAAYDEKLDRKVALKLLHNHGNTPEHQHQRIVREAKALARVTHARVVAVYDVGEADGQVYLAMEFINGKTLRAWQSAEARTWRETLGMYLHVGAGLHAAHQSGIVHRDFKPDNVLVGKDGLPRVADFGIARIDSRYADDIEAPEAPNMQPVEFMASHVTAGTSGGSVVGTLAYMSPEHHHGARVHARSDQWSYCAALYEALYGRLPFEGTNAGEHAAAIRGPLRSPPADSSVPPEIFRLLSRGLEAEPSARFPDMQALLDQIATEYEQSAGAAALSQRVLIGIVAFACFCVWLLLQYLLGHHARIVSYALTLSFGLVAATLAAGYQHRDTLRLNAFHRAIWALLLVTFIQNLFIRAIFTLRGPLPAELEVAIEMIVWTGTSLTMTLTLIRRMWWVVLVPFLAGSFAILSESPSRRLMLCVYPLIVGLVLWQWRSAARSHTP